MEDWGGPTGDVLSIKPLDKQCAHTDTVFSVVHIHQATAQAIDPLTHKERPVQTNFFTGVIWQWSVNCGHNTSPATLKPTVDTVSVHSGHHTIQENL